MWPATGMMVAGGLTALLTRWKVLARTFTKLTAGTTSDDVSRVPRLICSRTFCVVRLIEHPASPDGTGAKLCSDRVDGLVQSALPQLGAIVE
jgi:hypothetical protein